MTDKRAKVPGPDHSITIERNPSRVVVVVAGRVIADTCDAITLREESYAAVLLDARERDRAAGRTLDGPHRSDLLVSHLDKAMPARPP